MPNVKHYIIVNSTTFSKMFIVFGFLCALTASLTSGQGMDNFPWKYSYYHLNAISFYFYLMAFYLLIISNTPKWSNKWRTFVLFVVLCSLTNIGDEIAGTATELGMHDIYRLLGVLLILVIQRHKI